MSNFCEKVENEGLLIRLLDRELSEKEQEEVLAHLRQCEDCLALMADIMMADAELKQTVKVGVSFGVKDELEASKPVKKSTPKADDDLPDAEEMLEREPSKHPLAGTTLQVKDLPVGGTLNFDLYDTRGQLLIARDTPLSQQLLDRLRRRNITVVSVGPPDKPYHAALVREASAFNGRPDRDFYLSLQDSNIPASVSTIARQMAVDSLKKAFYQLGPEAAVDLDDVNETCDELVEDLVGDDVTSLSIIDMYLVDTSLYHHSINVTAIFATICRALNLPAERVKSYGVAAMLHDLGRVLLRKLARKRVPVSVDIEKLHTEAAYKYLKGLGGMEEGPLSAVRNHHERFDGRGYPRGVDVKELGDYGQALILANYYDRFTWNEEREIKAGYHQAANSIIQLTRKLVDTHIVTAFLNVFGHHPPGSWVQLSSSEVGMVVQATPFMPRRPKVHLFYDKEGESLTEVIPIDLSEPDMPDIVGSFHAINGTATRKPAKYSAP